MISLLIAGLGDAHYFRFKEDLPTLTRLAYCQCALKKVFRPPKGLWSSIAYHWKRETSSPRKCEKLPEYTGSGAGLLGNYHG